MNTKNFAVLTVTFAVLSVMLAPTTASANLIGDSVTVELLDGGGNSADLQSQIVTQGAGPEFILNTGSDEQVNVDIESSTISITYIENFGGFFAWGDSSNPVTVKVTDLDWVAQSGTIVGASIVSAPSGFGETVQVTGPHSIQVDTNIMNANGAFQPVTVVVQLQTQHSVAGELLPIDSTALFLAGMQTSAIWLIPSVVGIAGVGFYLVRAKMNKDA